MYKEEYSECTSIKGRFHQYFIFGKSVDCSQWKRDFENCVRWRDNHNSNALVKKKYYHYFNGIRSQSYVLSSQNRNLHLDCSYRFRVLRVEIAIA